MTERAQALEAAAEMLWVVVANVSGGDWSKQTPEWQEAAARWRDAYFAAVQPPPPGGSPTTAWIPTDGCDCATCNVARRSTPVEPAVTPTLQDALSALRYIRETHGALYGVGWDRLLPVEPAGASHTGWGPDKTRDCHCTACQGEPAGASESPSALMGQTLITRLYAPNQPSAVSPVEPTPEPPMLEIAVDDEGVAITDRLKRAWKDRDICRNRLVAAEEALAIERALVVFQRGAIDAYQQKLRAVRDCLVALSLGHRTGYDWNSDPLCLTCAEGDALRIIDATIAQAPQPTGAPAPCVWRDISTTQPAVDDIVLVYEEGHIGKALLDASGRWLDVEAGRDDAWFSVPPSHWMPFPTPPLTVER